MIILPPIKEDLSDYDAIESKIKELFKKEIYYPLLKEFSLPKTTIRNSIEDLIYAIGSGRITFSRGTFAGRFSSVISKELRSLGAQFDRPTGTYKIRQSSLPYEVRTAISASEFRFRQKLDRIDAKLAQILPEEIAGKLKVESHFDRAIWKVQRKFKDSVAGLTITPQLTKVQSKRISSEWEKNMQLWINDFTKKEISELRRDIQKAAFSGNRYESAIKTIQKSYGVTENKARFLARQETSLLMTKFKQARYQEVGVDWYKWGCVGGSKNHPVRPWHRALEGKTFRWDDPPITTKPGEAVRRNNPGQDYNCRCFARPMVNYRGTK